MDNLQLPTELKKIEHELRARSLDGPSPQLRKRVLDDVERRLRAERARSRWQFAAGVAAAALLWMNLSMSAAQDTDFGYPPNRSGASIEAIFQHIRQFTSGDRSICDFQATLGVEDRSQ